LIELRSMATNSSFTALPDDVLQRVLLGVPRDDHDATAAACRAFRAVIHGPRFVRLRQEYGFAERRITLVGCRHMYGPHGPFLGPIEIHVAGKHGAVAVIPEGLSGINPGASTTDGGARLFLATARSPEPNLVLAVDGSTRRWSRFATLPVNQHLQCLAWHGGLLYVAGGLGGPSAGPEGYSNTLRAFNETTGLWEELPPMPHACAMAATGVIGNELFIAGGRGIHHEFQSALQIYDFTARTWRLGSPLPHAQDSPCGIVVGDGKLYLVSLQHLWDRSTMRYDVQSNTWTELLDPRYDQSTYAMHAFAHNGRLVAVNTSSSAFHRGTGSDPSADVFWPSHWGHFDLDMAPGITRGVASSILFG
jgi:hypothetical protein